jgi:hypothetical protein
MRTGGGLSSPRLGARVERLLAIGNSSAPNINNGLSAHSRIDSNSGWLIGIFFFQLSYNITGEGALVNTLSNSQQRALSNVLRVLAESSGKAFRGRILFFGMKPAQLEAAC